MSIAFIYPGQGSQCLGMGKELYEDFEVVKLFLEKVNDTLGLDLKKLMFDGPEADLNLTENTQPALLCASMMVHEVLEKEFSLPINKIATCVAGHSLGEYSALTAAGYFAIEDSVKLVKKRGAAMQEAVPIGKGAMAALLGLMMADVEDIIKNCKDFGIVEIANDNSPGQVVISGEVRAVNKAIELAKEKGAKRALLLPVSAPFHSSLMINAANVMDDALSNVDVCAFKVPVYSNVTANICDFGAVKELLVQQITGRVRWVEQINNMSKQGIATFVEVGPGRVLSGLIKRILPDATIYNISNTEDLKKLTQLIGAV